MTTSPLFHPLQDPNSHSYSRVRHLRRRRRPGDRASRGYTWCLSVANRPQVPSGTNRFRGLASSSPLATTNKCLRKKKTGEVDKNENENENEREGGAADVLYLGPGPTIARRRHRLSQHHSQSHQNRPTLCHRHDLRRRRRHHRRQLGPGLRCCCPCPGKLVVCVTAELR
jgi:hypothetical protein